MMAVDCMWLFPAGQQEEVQEQVAAQQRQLLEAALQLSSRRREAGGKLKAAVEQCLAELAMQDSQFDVDLTWLPTQQARMKCLCITACKAWFMDPVTALQHLCRGKTRCYDCAKVIEASMSYAVYLTDHDHVLLHSVVATLVSWKSVSSVHRQLWPAAQATVIGNTARLRSSLVTSRPMEL